jgi:hypothetical protein
VAERDIIKREENQVSSFAKSKRLSGIHNTGMPPNPFPVNAAALVFLCPASAGLSFGE